MLLIVKLRSLNITSDPVHINKNILLNPLHTVPHVHHLHVYTEKRLHLLKTVFNFLQRTDQGHIFFFFLQHEPVFDKRITHWEKCGVFDLGVGAFLLLFCCWFVSPIY